MFIPLRAEPAGQVLEEEHAEPKTTPPPRKYRDPWLEVGQLFRLLSSAVVPWCFWVLACVWAAAELLFLLLSSEGA